jgi:hypothetical protein
VTNARTILAEHHESALASPCSPTELPTGILSSLAVSSTTIGQWILYLEGVWIGGTLDTGRKVLLACAFRLRFTDHPPSAKCCKKFSQSTTTWPPGTATRHIRQRCRAITCCIRNTTGSTVSSSWYGYEAELVLSWCSLMTM